jgi:hypothetical protein
MHKKSALSILHAGTPFSIIALVCVVHNLNPNL